MFSVYKVQKIVRLKGLPVYKVQKWFVYKVQLFFRKYAVLYKVQKIFRL